LEGQDVLWAPLLGALLGGLALAYLLAVLLAKLYLGRRRSQGKGLPNS